MILNIYICLGFLGIIFTIISLYGAFVQKTNHQIALISSVFGFGLLAYLALSSNEVTSVLALPDGSYHHIPMFEQHDATAMMWLMFIPTILCFFGIFINALRSFQDMMEPKWKRKLRDFHDRVL